MPLSALLAQACLCARSTRAHRNAPPARRVRWRPPPPPAAVRPLYLARGMPLLRAVTRLKLLHLGAAAAATAAATLAGHGATLAAATAGAAAGGAGAMTWLQARWVGALAVTAQGVRLSSLDARGRRADLLLPPGALVPPLAGLSSDDALKVLRGGPAVLAFDVEGSSKQFLIAPRSAAFVDAPALADLLAGREVAVDEGGEHREH